MGRIHQFLKSTILGGVLVLVPLGLLAVIMLPISTALNSLGRLGVGLGEKWPTTESRRN